MKPLRPRKGQESVWDYPRPPRLQPSSRRVRVELGGAVIADSTSTYRMLETSHPPVYYIPKRDVLTACLQPTTRVSFCEWKGRAAYYNVEINGRRAVNAAWEYPKVPQSYKALQGYLAFYPGLMDACYLDDERVAAQAGSYYGGWITGDIVGPFKGPAGTAGW